VGTFFKLRHYRTLVCVDKTVEHHGESLNFGVRFPCALLSVLNLDTASIPTTLSITEIWRNF
jgi:hypothetical protein